MAETIHAVASLWSGTTDSANGDRVNFSEWHGQALVSHDDASGTITVGGTVLSAGESAFVNLSGQRTLVFPLDANGFPFETAYPAETLLAGATSYDIDADDNGISLTSSANLAVTVTGI